MKDLVVNDGNLRVSPRFVNIHTVFISWAIIHLVFITHQFEIIRGVSAILLIITLDLMWSPPTTSVYCELIPMNYPCELIRTIHLPWKGCDGLKQLEIRPILLVNHKVV